MRHDLTSVRSQFEMRTNRQAKSEASEKFSRNMRMCEGPKVQGWGGCWVDVEEQSQRAAHAMSAGERGGSWGGATREGGDGCEGNDGDLGGDGACGGARGGD